MSTAIETPTEALLDGRYRLLALVGRGGSANVYRAEDQMLQRTVAIKLLRAQEGDSAPTERAYRETGLLASLSHPALVTLLDAQIAPGRPQYLVMEYVDGPTLSSLMAAGPLPPATVAGVAHDIAGALEAVHAAGIVHRDVKPSNILLAPPARTGARRRAKLTDFGISRAEDDVQVTSPGVVIGTAAYMAPEQVRCEDVAAPADVYSLGLLLIEALTGHPAFPQAGAVSTALARLSSSPEVPEWVGPEWRALLTRMTDQDPAKRPPASEVADAASALADSSPDAVTLLGTPPPLPDLGEPHERTDAVTTPLPERAITSVRRPARGRVALAATGALLVASALAAGVWATAGADGAARLGVRMTDKPVVATTDQTDETPVEDTPASPADTMESEPPKEDDSNKGPGSNSSGKDDKPKDKGKDKAR